MPETLKTELDREKRLLERIENMANIGHWHIDVLNNKLFWSKGIYHIHGVDPHSYIPTVEKAIEFYHPDEQQDILEHVQNSIKEKRSYSYKARLIQPSGKVRHVEAYGEPEIHDGEVTAVFGIFSDMTEQTLKQQEITDTKRFFEAILANLPDPIFVKDKDSKILLGNTAFLGLYPENMRNDIIGETTVESYPTDQAEAFLAEDRKAIEEGYTETFETIDFPDGTRKSLFTKKLALQRANGEKNLLGIARDVTDITRAQEELERSNKDLQDFAFTVSHDLKAPLRHISMSASFIEDAIKDKLEEDQLEFLKIMMEGAEKAQYMIDNLLEYSRIGRNDIELKNVDLNILLNNVLSTLSYEIDEKAAQINLKKLPEIKGNEGLLLQLFQNIIENSLKYTELNEVPKIKIYAETSSHFYNIHIEDEGIGIKPEFADKVFLMFQRLHGEDSPYKGMGIGLALCQKIVRAHKGQIVLDKDYKKGAGFIISFPIN